MGEDTQPTTLATIFKVLIIYLI